MIKKIIITGDVLRPWYPGGILEAHQNLNINNRYLLFRHLFKSITELEVGKCYWNSKESFDTPYFYQLLDCPLESELSWFSIFNKKDLPIEAENYLLNFFQNAFIVGFELSPMFTHFFNRHNIPYIKLIDYPVRFLDDTMAGLSTNNSDIFEVAKSYRLEEEGFYIHAALAKIRLQNANILEEDSAVFFGQTQIDLSLYKEGMCLNVLDFEKEIAAIAQNHKKLYFKRHPYATHPSEALSAFIKKYNIEYITNNAYEILANEKLKTVVSISSSVLEEAKYFQKNTICLHRMPHQYANKNLDKFDSEIHLPIGAEILSPNLWLNIFNCLDLAKNNNFKDFLSYEANTFRFSTAAFWGYDRLYKPALICADIHGVQVINNHFKNELNECKTHHSTLNEKHDIMHSCLTEQTKVINQLEDELNEYKIHNSNLMADFNALKEINSYLSNCICDINEKYDHLINSSRLEQTKVNNQLNSDIQELKEISNSCKIKINEIEENFGIWHVEFKEFKLHCQKLYKIKIIPALNFLQLKLRKIIFSKSH